jgi:hypothetical protein
LADDQPPFLERVRERGDERGVAPEFVTEPAHRDRLVEARERDRRRQRHLDPLSDFVHAAPHQVKELKERSERLARDVRRVYVRPFSLILQAHRIDKIPDQQNG